MIYPITRPAVLKAVEKFHETVTKNHCFALTTVWNTCKEPDTCQSNFESALMGEESFTFAMAEMIRVAAQKYDVKPSKFVEKISEYVEDLENFYED